MATPVLTLKAGDTYPPLEFVLEQNGVALDLTDAESVEVVLKGNTTSTIITGACTITDAPTGVGAYQWEDDDTATIDQYQVEWMVTWSNPPMSITWTQTFPNDATANPVVAIVARLDGAVG